MGIQPKRAGGSRRGLPRPVDDHNVDQNFKALARQIGDAASGPPTWAALRDILDPSIGHPAGQGELTISVADPLFMLTSVKFKTSLDPVFPWEDADEIDGYDYIYRVDLVANADRVIYYQIIWTDPQGGVHEHVDSMPFRARTLGLDPDYGKVDEGIETAGGGGVFVKNNPATPNDLDGVPDSATWKRTTPDEKTGGGYGFEGLEPGGFVQPGKVDTDAVQNNAITTAKIADANLTIAKFAAGIRPVELLGTLGSAGTQGRIAFLTSDNKLYRDTGSAWTAAVPTVDLTGTISTAQIADAAITTAKFASGIRPVEILGTLGSAGTQGRTAFLTTDNKLYRDTGSAWTAAVPTVDLTGTISTVQIADFAVTVAKLNQLDHAVTGLTITNNNPIAGSILMSAFTISWNGNTYSIAGDDVVAATPYAWLDRSVSTVTLRHDTKANFEAAFDPVDGDILIAINDGGVGRLVFNNDFITGDVIKSRTIAAGHIVANTITANEIAAATITATQIAAATITGGKIAASTITGSNIAANTITASNIAANTITASEIAADTITAGQIAAGAISSSELAANAVIAGKIAAGVITATEIAALTITGAQIAALTITGAKIAANTITASEIAANTITAGQIAAAAIGATEIAADAIRANMLYVGVGGAALNADPECKDPSAWTVSAGTPVFTTVTDGEAGMDVIRTASGTAATFYGARKIPVDALKTYRIRFRARKSASGNTGTLNILPNFYDNAGSLGGGSDVTGDFNPTTSWVEYSGQFGAGTSFPIPGGKKFMVPYVGMNRGTIGTGYHEIQDLRIEEAVPGTLIKDGAIITDKLAANAVTAAKIAANTITASQIAAGTITATQIAAGTITGTQIAADTISGIKIQAGTIEGGHIASATITAGKISVSTLAALAVDTGILSAGRMDNASSNPTAGIRLTNAYSKPGTWTTYWDMAATGSNPAFVIDGAIEVLADGTSNLFGKLTLDGDLSQEIAFEYGGTPIGSITTDLPAIDEEQLRINLAGTERIFLDPATMKLTTFDLWVDAGGDVLIDAGDDLNLVFANLFLNGVEATWGANDSGGTGKRALVTDNI